MCERTAKLGSSSPSSSLITNPNKVLTGGASVDVAGDGDDEDGVEEEDEVEEESNKTETCGKREGGYKCELMCKNECAYV